MSLKRNKLFGFDFVNESNIQDVNNNIFQELDCEIDNNSYPVVLTPNVDYLIKLDRTENKFLKDFLKKSKYILPDGQPIVWASKITNFPLKSRLTGSDLFPLMFDECVKKKVSILLLTSDEALTQFYRKFEEHVHVMTLPLIRENNIESICDDIIKIYTEFSVKVIFTGVGFPSQDLLCVNIFNKLESLGRRRPLICLFGASLQFYAGHKKRAPKSFQYFGIEWVFRFFQEPRRLFRRYFIDSLHFVKLIFKINQP